MESTDAFKRFLDVWLNDLEGTFPEYKEQLDAVRARQLDSVSRHLKQAIDKNATAIEKHSDSLFVGAADFLPGVPFATLWKLDISENTKKAMWKHLEKAMCYTLFGDVFFEHMHAKTDADEDDEAEHVDVSGAEKLFGGLFEDMMEDGLPEELTKGKLACIIAEIVKKLTPAELGIDQEGGSFFAIARKLLEKKDDLTKKIVDIVVTTIRTKIDTGEITEDELKSEFEGLKGLLSKFMPAAMGMSEGHEERAARDPRRQRIHDRLKKRLDARRAQQGGAKK
jgi:hypothetical protein